MQLQTMNLDDGAVGWSWLIDTKRANGGRDVRRRVPARVVGEYEGAALGSGVHRLEILVMHAIRVRDDDRWRTDGSWAPRRPCEHDDDQCDEEDCADRRDSGRDNEARSCRTGDRIRRIWLR